MGCVSKVNLHKLERFSTFFFPHLYTSFLFCVFKIIISEIKTIGLRSLIQSLNSSDNHPHASDEEIDFILNMINTTETFDDLFRPQPDKDPERVLPMHASEPKAQEMRNEERKPEQTQETKPATKYAPYRKTWSISSVPRSIVSSIKNLRTQNHIIIPPPLPPPRPRDTN